MSKLSTLIALIFLLSACGIFSDEETTSPPPNTPTTILKVSGSGSVVAMLRGLEADLEADVPSYDLDILTGTGTGGGVEGISQGLLDIAAMARPPKDSELEATPDLVYVELGTSGIGLFAHVDVGVTDLTRQQVIDILTGNITNWSEVGGEDSVIKLFVRDEEEAATQLLRSEFIGDADFAANAVLITSASDMVTSVETTRSSFGFGTWTAVLGDGADVQPISIDGIPPTSAEYPMQTAIGLGYLESQSERVLPVIEWFQSETGQTGLHRLGIIRS